MNTTRRGFLQQSTTLAASGWLTNLAAISNAAAQTAPTDYKALVCVFLLGGSDHANTVVPFDGPTHSTYQTQRPNIYHVKGMPVMGTQHDNVPINANYPYGSPTRVANIDDLVLSSNTLPSGRSFALAPSLVELHKLYQDSKLAVLLNVGPMIEPTIGIKVGSTIQFSKPKLDAAGKPVAARTPPRLASHNDQVSAWQSSNPEGSVKGWGGSIGDQTGAGNSNPVFTAISVKGNTVYLTGDKTTPYLVTTEPKMSVSLAALRSPVYGSTAVSTALGQIVTGKDVVTATSHVMQQDITAVMKRSIGADDVMRGIPRVDNDAAYSPLNALAGTNYLANQLRTVAHLIFNRKSTGIAAKRQVFFVGLDGFDTHSNQIANHPKLLQQVSQAMKAFHDVLDAQRDDDQVPMSNKVTTFTASDFGRTFNSNNDGTDHGWGGHHFIMGGAVNGGKIYGKAPIFGAQVKTGTLGGYETYEDADRGALIPTTSVDQYAATLATWMGVPKAQLPNVLPNIANFDVPGWGLNLGFMKA